MDWSDRLREAAKEINKAVKYDVAIAGADNNWSDVADRVIPTTSKMLNLLLGGGCPLGRIAEIYGDPSTGKSTLASHIMIGFQQAGGISVLLDAETSWKRDRALRMGHDPDRHLHLQADTVELGFQTLFETLDRLRAPGRFPTDMPIVFVWDTISASQTEGEKANNRYQDGIADKPRKVREGCRRITSRIAQSNASLVFISQTITQIKTGGFGGGPKKLSASGGDAIKFFASKRIKTWHIQRFNYPSTNSGILIGASNIKDKMEAPNRRVDMPITYSHGVDYGYEMLLFMIDNTPHASLYGGKVHVVDYPEPGEELVFYQKKLNDVLEQYPDLLEHMEACVDEAWDSGVDMTED